jgi:Vitamin B12 dependent methionine synthase, activation domain
MFGNQDENLLTQVDWDKILSELEALDQIQGGYYIFEDIHFNKGRKIITLGDVPFYVGGVLFPRFKNVEKIAVTLCTAGSKLDELSQNYINNGENLIGYFINALGNLITDKALENIKTNLKNSTSSLGYSITECYCPGYCDWPLSEQKKIFSLLPEKFCNVILTDSCLMLPLKSVSGLIGIGINVQEDFPQCRICSLTNCYMRKEVYYS